MTKQVQLRRGTTAEHAVFTGAEGELTVDTTLDIAVVHDGVTVGGRPLVGAAATQQIVNKTGVGIGTSSIIKEFELVGDANIEGQINARGLTVRYQQPVVRSGIISATSNNRITGIATNNIRVGYGVSGTYISIGSSVSSIGIATIFLTQNTSSLTGVSTGKFLTNNGTVIIGVSTVGIASVGYAVSATGILNNTTVSGISTNYGGQVTLSQSSSGTLGITTITGSVADIGIATITGIATANLQLGDEISSPYIGGSGISTIVSIGTSTITAAIGIGTSGSSSFEFSRIVSFVFVNTNIGIDSITFLDPLMGQVNADVVNANKVAISTLTVSQPVGSITITNSTTGTAGITSATITNSYVTNQVVTTQNVNTNNISNANIASGIITSAGITTASVDTAYIRSGINTSFTTTNFVVGAGSTYIVSIATTSATFSGINTSVVAISTVSLQVGDIINGTYISTNSVISSIGSGTIAFSPNSSSPVGVATTTLTITRSLNPVGIATISNLLVQNTVSSGIITAQTVNIESLNLNVGIATTVGVSSIRSNNLFFNVGIGTTTSFETSSSNLSYVRSGINTFLNVTGFATVGDVTIGLNRPYNVVQSTGTISTTSTFITGINTSGIQVGQFVVGPFMGANATVIAIGSSQVELTQANSLTGVQTSLFEFLSKSTINLDVNGNSRVVGILTVGLSSITIDGNNSTISGINTINLSRLNVINNIVANDQLSYTYQGTLSVASTTIISGVSTVGVFPLFTVSGTDIPANAYVVGVGVSTITLNNAATNSGVSTTNFTFTNGDTGINTLPVLTGRNLNYSGISTLNQVLITSGNISSITASKLDMANSGVASISTLRVQTGIITDLSGTNLNYSGISTLGNVVVGLGTTSLLVNGNARITGVLTIGQGSVTINGNTDSIYGISTVSATSGIITTLAGTGVSYTSVSVGSTLSFVGVNTFNSLDKTVQFKLSNSGIATNYTLTLPPNRGRDGMSLTIDANGNLGFSTNPGGLYENRLYVSSANGNDADDGKTKPVKSIKRAAQLASFESYVLPASRFIDGANRLEANRTFIMDQAVGFVTFAYPGITTNPDWDRSVCARDIGLIVDALVYDLTYNGNSKSVEAGISYIVGIGTSTYVDGEKTETIAGIRHIFEMSKFLINNVAITTSNLKLYPIGFAQTSFQSFDNTILYDQACNPTGYSTACCANVQSSIVNLVGIVTSIIGVGTTAAPVISYPTTKSQPVCIIVEAGEYLEDNPVILYDDVAVVGDNLRNTIIRPLNAGKDLFRVRNGCYLTGFALKDYADAAGVPQFTFDYAVAFDDPADPLVSRTGYAVKTSKTFIIRSPYIQNCSILSFLGANGVLVDGSKVLSPNKPVVPEEAELAPDLIQPEQGKSMVAAAFTMISFGGIGWRVINDGYSQVVSCFQIFCKYGSLTQSGGYLSITNSATNFGLFALRSTGFSQNSFAFDRGRVAATGTAGGFQTLVTIGVGRSDQDLYVTRFFTNTNVDQTNLFKPLVVTKEFNAGAAGVVDLALDQFNITAHGFNQGDSVVYFGDEGVIPSRVIGGLVNQNQYYVQVLDVNSFKLFEDNSFTKVVNLTAGTTGINTFTKNNQEFFVKEIITSGTHNSYQSVGLASTSSTVRFVSGRQVTQSVVGGNAVGFALTYLSASRQLVVSVEAVSGVRRNFAVTGGANGTISDHSPVPVAIAATSVAGVSTYWTINFKIASTVSGTQVIGISSLPETYKCHFHRPSIVNSSSHTWEYSGSGVDYNALPQNGGKTVLSSQQVSELGGRVYTSGTNELGDFLIGDFITAFNRTGNIIFNNTVTIGTLDSIRLSLSGGVQIEEFSTDVGLGDNEIGGPADKRVSTQLATRTFLQNRLGSFIDKTVSTNAIPSAVVQLNSIGQINADLIPPKVVNYFKTIYPDGRISLANRIPAANINSGDTVVEPINAYVLVSDVLSQFIILDNNTTYNLQNGDSVIGAVSQGGAVGLVTAPPYQVGGAIGYGTTGLVKGVGLTLNTLAGGSGYSSAGIYSGVQALRTTGIGTGMSLNVTVSAAGTVSAVAIETGGKGYAIGDYVTVAPANVGGRTGGSDFTIRIGTVETRLYLTLTNNQKFLGSVSLPDYFADRNAVAVSTNVGLASTATFTGTGIDVGGSVDFTNDRIVVGASNTIFSDGDPVVYYSSGNPVVPLILQDTYFIKKVGITSVELYDTYALSSKVNLTDSGTGSHTLTRLGINTTTNQITFVNHPFTQGDPIRITVPTGSVTPIGITTNAFYFIGSKTVNAFTLHLTRSDALLSTNGLLFNTVDITGVGTAGITSFTKQNITYTSTVNTSSTDLNNWALLATSTVDAANIVSGTVSPTRLGSGTANNQTFLRGDSSYQKVIMSVGIGTTQPIAVTATSTDFAPGGVGVNTYYGNINFALNRVYPSIDTYGTLGIAAFKNSTFGISTTGTGQVFLKTTSQGGDVDAATFNGNAASYYLDINNITGNIPIARGGTGLQALPAAGAILIGNGSSYTLTTTPTFSGDVTFGGGANAITLSANSDITLISGGTWSGNTNGKIQYYNSSLYLTFATSLILRTGAVDTVTFSSVGAITAASTIQGTRLISTIATGTAPLTVTSTTVVANLNASFLEGYSTATANTANSIVRRDGSGNFTAGTITATTFSGSLSGGTVSATTGAFTGQISSTLANSTTTGGGQIYLNGATGNRIDFNINGVAAPTFTTRSVGTKLVLYPAVGASSVDYAFGIESSTLWSSVGAAGDQFKWYAGTTNIATLAGSGNFTATGILQGTRFTSTVTTGTAPLTVSSTTLVSNLNAEYWNGSSSASYTPSMRSNRNITGGGIITVDASFNIYWSNRFIVISNGRGSNFSTNGYFDIYCPTSGTITGVGGASNVTATASGIPLASWTALYYILPIGSSNGSLVANFRVATYTSDFDIPVNWVLIAVRNSDNPDVIYFNNGVRLRTGQTKNMNYGDSFFSTDLYTVNTGNAYNRLGAGQGFLSGNYSSSETSGTSGAIYSIGGSYLPGTTTLGNMYGIGYGYAGNGGISRIGSPNNNWGMYVAQNGTNSIFLNADNGTVYARGLNRTNQRITNSEFVPVGHYSGSETCFAIDPTWSQDQLQSWFNSTNVTWVADSTSPGGYAIQISGSVNIGGEYDSGFPYIPVDSSDIFYMECWIRNTSGANGHYMGSNEYDHSFTSLGGNPGSYGYWVMSNTNPGASWTKVSGQISGFGNSVGQFKSGTKYWTPMALFNYTGGGTCYISGLKVIRVYHPGNRTFTGTVTANSDIKLKKNIITIENALEKTLALRGVEFDRVDTNEHSIGVIAQEVEEVLPMIVHGSETKSVAYQNMVALLIEAVKEQNGVINNLRDELDNLKKKLGG